MRETQIRSKEVYSGEIKHILTEVLQNNLDSSLEIRRLTAESDESLIEKFRVRSIKNLKLYLQVSTDLKFQFI